MPIYIYKNPQTEEIKEVVQTMSEPHVFFEDGLEWKRVFTKPMAAIDTNIDANSAKEFVQKTGNKKGTFGDIMDLSAELSEKRACASGEDPIKRKFFDDYKKKNNGAKHLADKPKKIETKIATIDFD